MYPQQIIDALKQVRYPGTGKNIVESGMLEDDIRINGAHISFSLLFEKETDPFMRSVVKAAEAAVKAYADPRATVEIKTRTRLTPRPEPDKMLPEVKNVIAVSSGKGGVGKSTVAVNLAVALAQMGFQVGLLDTDLFGPSAPKMFDLENVQIFAETASDGRQLLIPAMKYGVRVLSIGFFVRPEQATLWRGGMASNALKQLIGDTSWGALDFLILDTPPGTSDIHLTLLQTLAITGAVIVSTPQQVALADARKGVDMYRNEKVGVPILGLVENMAWFTPAPHPDERYFIFGQGGVEALAHELDVPVLAQIPLVAELSAVSDAGTPAALDAEAPMGQAFRQLAQRVVEATERRNASQPPTHVVETH